MEVEEIRKKLKSYIASMKQDKVPNRFEFAKVCDYPSYKALQRDMAKQGDDGRDIIEEIDNEIYIYLINLLAKSKKSNEVLARKHLLSIAGLQEKSSLDIGLKPIAEGTANIDFALMARVRQVTNKEEALIENKNE